MHETAAIENEQERRYPGLRVRRENGAVVVHIPMRFRRRNGRQMILTEGQPSGACESDANHTLIDALAKAHRWQEQLESGEYTSIEDLARAVGVDRTYAGRILRLTSLAPDIIEAILRGDEPEGISLARLHNDLPICWRKQRERWCGKG